MKLLVEIDEDTFNSIKQNESYGVIVIDKLLDTIKNATPITECEDCISRKAVEDITWQDTEYTDALNVLTEVRDKVRELPSVYPKSDKPSGEWITEYDDWGNSVKTIRGYRCSKCNVVNDDATYYCPNCGAKMDCED